MIQISMKHDGAVMGPLYMVTAGALFAGANIAVQWAGMRLGAPAPTIAFWQYAIALALVWPLVGTAGWPRAQWGAHLLRIITAVIGVQFWVAGLTMVPIWQAIALILTSPLFVTLGAVVWLKEPLTPARGGAVVMGAIGGVLILAPWTDAFQWPALLPVAAAAFWAISSLLAKRLAATQGAGVLTLALVAGIVPANAVAALGTGFALGGAAAGVVILAGVLTAAAQYALARAYRVADAAYLQPFDHLKLPMNVALGFAVFGFAPPGLAWLGAAIILAAGAWVMQREV